jgi:hypothetical protein
MALGDYLLCANCEMKAIYDASVDCPKGVVVKALCSDCAGYLQLVVRPRKAELIYKPCPYCGELSQVFDAQALGEPIRNVKEYLDRELPESVADRAERLADRHLRDDGTERGRR